MTFDLQVETLPADENKFMSRVLGTAALIGLIGLVGLTGLQHNDHFCPVRDLCQTTNATPPDEPAERDPANPLSGLRIAATASSSTITPTNAVTPTNSK
jgi:hypothetical protein